MHRTRALRTGVSLLIVLALSVTSAVGLYLYHQAAEDLDTVVNRTPRKDRLTYELSCLVHPLSLTPTTRGARLAQQEEVRELIQNVRLELGIYREKTELLTTDDSKPADNKLAGYLVRRLERNLRQMDADADALDQPGTARMRLTSRLHAMLTTVTQLPSPPQS